MKFLIPSYKRPDTIASPRELLKAGYTGDEILVGTQTKADYEAYSRRMGDEVQVVYAPKVNVAGNRNTLLDHLKLGEQAVLLDDDWNGLTECVVKEGYANGTSRRLPHEEFKDFFALGFATAEAVGVTLWGVFGAHNNMYMHGAMQRFGDVTFGMNLTGSFMALTNMGLRFDEGITLSQDTEFSMHHVDEGYGSIRLNRFAISRLGGKEGYTPGGAYEFYRAGVREIDYRSIIERYPHLLKRASKGLGFTILREGKTPRHPQRAALSPEDFAFEEAPRQEGSPLSLFDLS